MSVANPTALVIGYGNTLRGDDGVGFEVAEAVARWGLPGGAAPLPCRSWLPELAEDLVKVASLIVFVDACPSPEVECVQVEPLQPADQFEALGHTSDPAVLLGRLTLAVYGRCPRCPGRPRPGHEFRVRRGLSPAAARGGRNSPPRGVARLLRAAGTIACPSDL